MDEEELYSSVARHEAGDAGVEPGRDADAANDDTFGDGATDAESSDAGGTAGGGSVSGRDGGGSSSSLATAKSGSGPAWGSVGAGVAAVSGGARCAPPAGISIHGVGRAEVRAFLLAKASAAATADAGICRDGHPNQPYVLQKRPGCMTS